MTNPVSAFQTKEVSSSFVRVNVSDATPGALDWVVAKLENLLASGDLLAGFSPTRSWRDGGRIMEREDIFPAPTNYSNPSLKYVARTNTPYPRCEQYGPTPLIAAMRCYVMSKLGESIDVPDAFQVHGMSLFDGTLPVSDDSIHSALKTTRQAERTRCENLFMYWVGGQNGEDNHVDRCHARCLDAIRNGSTAPFRPASVEVAA